MIEYKKNGWVDPYPHNDFDHPCTGPCCIPEAYEPPYWHCGGCDAPLRRRGTCEDCVKRVASREEP